MAIDWSDRIVLAQLNDEPMLSEELAGLIDQLEARAEAASADGGTADQDDLPSVVLDFSAVGYINSSNIAQLLRLRRVLDSAHKQLRLCAMSDEVWSVMIVTGLEKIFVTSPDTLTALAGLQLSDADGYADEEI